MRVRQVLGSGARRETYALVDDDGRVVELVDDYLALPYCLSDPDGSPVEPVSEFLRDLQAAGRPATTQRSYSLALLRWFRFTWAVGVPVGSGDQERGPRLLPASPGRG
jgi:hypothetical protein